MLPRSNDWVKPKYASSSSSSPGAPRAMRGAVGVESGGVAKRESAMEGYRDVHRNEGGDVGTR